MGWKPRAAVLKKAKEYLEERGDLLKDGHYVELTEKAKEGVRRRVASRARVSRLGTRTGEIKG